MSGQAAPRHRAGADKPAVVIVTGYYDTFSGYQEVVLAREMARHARVTVVCGDRVSPIFTDATLGRLAIPRRYERDEERDGDVRVLRVPYLKIPSLLLAPRALRVLRRLEADLVMVLAVGQGFSAPAAWVPRGATRVSIFGDNYAQWAGLSPAKARIKAWGFRWSKGILYRAVTRRCDRSYGNTPDTLTRLADVCGGRALELLPLPVDPAAFTPDEADRARTRAQHGAGEGERILAVVGKVAPEKCIELALDAAEELADDTRWRLWLTGLGDDEYSTSLRRRVRETPALASRVECLGFLSPQELASVLRAADVCLWPKQPAITIQQAAVSGCRIVVPDNDLVGHLTQDGGCGSTFTEGDPESMVVALRRELGSTDTAETRLQRAERSAGLRADAICLRLLKDTGVLPG